MAKTDGIKVKMGTREIEESKFSMNRSAKWDNAKFVLIWLVVLGHFVESGAEDYISARQIFFGIYSIHMPAFIFISGLFSKKNIRQKSYHRIVYYLKLYLFTKIVAMLTFYFINGEIRFSLFKEKSLPWYVFALFVFNLLGIAVNQFDKRKVLLWSILVACLAGYDNSIEDFLVLSRIIVYFPFFWLGYCLDISKISAFLEKKIVRIASLGIWIGAVCLVYFKIDDIYWLRPLITGRNPFARLEDYSENGAILRCIYYVIVLILILAFFALISERHCIISNFGKRTLQVYSFHLCVMRVFYDVLFGLSWMKGICPEDPYLVAIPISIIVTVVLSLNWKQLFSFWK